MKFSRISVTSRGVELDFERRDDDASEEVKWTSQHRPLPEFTDALQGFGAYVVDLIPFLKPIQDALTITTLNLSADKNGLRGLIVTARIPVEKAYGKPLILNTPLVREGGESASDDAFVLSDEVLELIELAESEARRYQNGEHEQGELFTKEQRTAQADSENVRQFNDTAAAAEVKSTRKPKAKKGKDFIPGVGDVANPDATEVLTDAKLRQLLLMVERDVPIDAIATWTSSERSEAEAWARMRQQELAGSLKAKQTVPAEPACVKASATLPLTADTWSDPHPPKPTLVDAAAIQDAARH